VIPVITCGRVGFLHGDKHFSTTTGRNLGGLPFCRGKIAEIKEIEKTFSDLLILGCGDIIIYCITV
jgi:hypothetical protein